MGIVLDYLSMIVRRAMIDVKHLTAVRTDIEAVSAVVVVGMAQVEQR